MNAALKYDILETCHDDYDAYIYQEDIEVLKSVHAISLGDLMGEDHDIWIQKNSKFGFNLEIDNENTETILKEEGIHPAAIESLALFCKKFLGTYENYCDKNDFSLRGL